MLGLVNGSGHLSYMVITISKKQYLPLILYACQVLSTTAVHNCESRCKEQGIRFFHFNPTLAEKVESNETSNAKLFSMMWAARVYVH